MSFINVILGTPYARYQIFDKALSIFEKSDSFQIPQSENSAKRPDDFEEVFDYLEKEGFVKSINNGYRITQKGRAFVAEGGYIGRITRDRVSYICVIIAAVASVITLVLVL